MGGEDEYIPFVPRYLTKASFYHISVSGNNRRASSLAIELVG
jgi:hypothetical protein